MSYPFLSGHLVNILPLFIRTFCKYFIPFYWDISNTVFWSLLSVPITFRSYPFLSGQFQCLRTNSVARFIRNDVKQNISDHGMLLFLALFSTWMTQSSNQRLWSFSAAAAVECSRVCLKIGQWGFLFCSEPSYKSPRQQLRVSRSGILLGTLGLTGL